MGLRTRLWLFCPFLWLGLVHGPQADSNPLPTALAPLQHDLRVTLSPATGRLEVEDRLHLPEAGAPMDLELHAGLAPRLTNGQGRLTPLGRRGDLERFRLEPAPGERDLALSYAGTIRHPLVEIAESLGRGHQVTRGHIGPEGVYLDGGSGWYPGSPGRLHRFRLEARLPPGWLAVSQGRGPEITTDARETRVRWEEHQPQDDLYLVAAPFHPYRRASAGAEAQVFLREADPALADRYLEATGRYLDLYGRLLGPYPYAKFALVENFWDSGYGMPSFTLLGPRVIRLPFILTSSYPHEILHNWWGNGVYPDYASGNWSEGLTTYLADHLLKEEQGQGATYRRAALQRYGDYVAKETDFPLREFRARHGAASQSVGYDKGLMLFHMLRRELGDQGFVSGLRHFYQARRFQVAGFGELRQSFETTSGRDLEGFFQQWLERVGAPRLALERVEVNSTPEGFAVTGRVRQTQSGEPYRLRVPLLAHQARGEPVEVTLNLTGREAPFRIPTPKPPLRLALDPRFDLFRALYPEESPPTLGALFGAGRGLLLVPAKAPANSLAGYRSLADAWRARQPGWEVRMDDEVSSLPQDRPIWLLGWENRFLGDFRGRLKSGGNSALDPRLLDLDPARLAREHGSLALVAHGPTAAPPLALLGAADPGALPGLARKLPHYGASSWVLFRGGAPDMAHRDQWPAGASPLSRVLGPGGEGLTVPPSPPLTRVLD